MSAYNRYSFTKKLKRRSIVLLRGKNRYISYGKDMKILKYIKFNMEYNNSNLSYLDKYEINYFVLEDLNVIIDKKFNANNYIKYLKLSYLSDIVNEIGNNLKNKLL